MPDVYRPSKLVSGAVELPDLRSSRRVKPVAAQVLRHKEQSKGVRRDLGGLMLARVERGGDVEDIVQRERGALFQKLLIRLVAEARS